MSKSAIPKLVQRILSRFPTERISMLRKAGMADTQIAASVILASVPKDKLTYLVNPCVELGINIGELLSYLVDGITPEEVADELFDGIDDVSEAERAEGLDYIRTAYRILSQAISEYFGTSTKIPDTVKKGGRGLAAKTRALRHSIQAAFDEADKPVTVRQMFYMLTVREALEKEESGYRKAQRQLLAMRREDVIPYNWISDNTRWMRKPITYKSLSDFFARSARYYRQDLWIRSSDYVEVWCEKDALAGVLLSVTGEYDVPLMVARGYSSETFAFSAAEAMREAGKPCYVYYVGDFDPSGWQMAQSLEAKLREFGAPVTFKRLAVNEWQVSAWDLPTRPTKKSDTRCKAFFNTFGKDTPSVELDALHPNRLRGLVREAIEAHINNDELTALRLEEKAAREALEEMAIRVEEGV